MDELETLRGRVETLERRARWSLALIILVGAGLLSGAGRSGHGEADVLRASGLIIYDHSGRERIVLGAPLKNASDDRKLRDAVGLAVLDSAGRLHVAVGANNPLVLSGGELGTRIASSAGLTFYDPRDGKERGGIGAFADGRANVCIDYGTGTREAACMAVAPGDQYAAVLLNGTPNEPGGDRVTMYVGADGLGSIKAFGGGEDRGGVWIQAGAGKTGITVYDSTGSKIGRVSPASDPR